MSQFAARKRTPDTHGTPGMGPTSISGHTLLADLETAGVLAPWPLHSGRCTTLSPWAAQQLGLELLELHQRDPVVTRWCIAQPPRRVKIRQRFSARQDILLGVVDGAPGPPEHAMAVEARERWQQDLYVVEDYWSGKPLLLCGAEVYLDPRLKMIQAPKGRPRGSGKKQGKQRRAV
jgi:hypothetical protein